MSNERTISLPQRFDFSCHSVFTGQYQACLKDQQTNKIVLDFTGVSYMDSSALGMMVLLHKKAKPLGIQTSYSGAMGTVDDILQMANMHKLYGIE